MCWKRGTFMIDPENLEIWCDKPSDRQLVIALGKISDFFAKIKAVHILPT
jgi:hypothetical protein